MRAKVSGVGVVLWKAAASISMIISGCLIDFKSLSPTDVVILVMDFSFLWFISEVKKQVSEKSHASE